jgi:hypothetical protein
MALLGGAVAWKLINALAMFGTYTKTRAARTQTDKPAAYHTPLGALSISMAHTHTIKMLCVAYVGADIIN